MFSVGMRTASVGMRTARPPPQICHKSNYVQYLIQFIHLLRLINSLFLCSGRAVRIPICGISFNLNCCCYSSSVDFHSVGMRTARPPPRICHKLKLVQYLIQFIHLLRLINSLFLCWRTSRPHPNLRNLKQFNLLFPFIFCSFSFGWDADGSSATANLLQIKIGSIFNSIYSSSSINKFPFPLLADEPSASQFAESHAILNCCCFSSSVVFHSVGMRTARPPPRNLLQIKIGSIFNSIYSSFAVIFFLYA